MSRMKSSLRRIKFKLKHDFFTVENIVLVVAIGLCLVWTYQSIAAMSRNWELSERLTEERKKLELISLEVEATELTNEYYKSNEYQELMARRNLDKKLSGENMVVMPENSETAKNKHKDELRTIAVEEPEYSNFEKWMMYLFPKY
ncbi:MAG: hypothetical protein K6G49_02770 [Candidatus Saccharibacteria bacterium]|nr:hypothetical protein [Candidatus Saccharibacteria bacterium]